MKNSVQEKDRDNDTQETPIFEINTNPSPLKNLIAGVIEELVGDRLDRIESVLRRLGSQQTYSVKEVASIINKHYHTVRGYIEEGELEANRVGRSYLITQQQLEDFLIKTNYEE